MVTMVSLADDVRVPKAHIHHQELSTLATTALRPLQMMFHQQKYKRKLEIKPNSTSKALENLGKDGAWKEEVLAPHNGDL